MIRPNPIEETRPILGPCLAIYKAPRFHIRQAGHVGILACLIFVLPLCIALYRAYTGYNGFGPVAAAAWSRPWFSLALAGLFVCLFLTVRLVLLSRRRLALHVHGLLITGLSRPLTLLYPWPRQLFWSQISGLAIKAQRAGEKARTVRYQLTIYPTRGLPAKLAGREGSALKPGELAELSNLIERLKLNLYPRLKPDLLQTFMNGNPLTFGPLTIQRKYLRPRRTARPVAWEKIRGLHVQNGWLVVESIVENSATHHIRIPVSKIPNLELLLYLVEQGDAVSQH